MGSTAVVVGKSSEVDELDGVGLLTQYPSMGLVWMTEMNSGWVAAGAVDITELA